jgi:hypothetical protein
MRGKHGSHDGNIQFPLGDPPGGGTLGFPKSGLAPAPKTWPKTVFGTKLLIYIMFFWRIWPNAPDPVPWRMLGLRPCGERRSKTPTMKSTGYRALIPSIGLLLPEEVSTFIGVDWRAAYRKG